MVTTGFSLFPFFTSLILVVTSSATFNNGCSSSVVLPNVFGSKISTAPPSPKITVLPTVLFFGSKISTGTSYFGSFNFLGFF